MKPRLLDLFSGAGGCAKGYQRAGFYVVGVDVLPQKNYCGDEFVQDDALEYIAKYGHEFDAIHASPECQGYSVIQSIWGKKYRMQIADVREALQATGKPYVIENVEGARSHMINPLMLCGTMFGMRILRHRLFECEPPVYFPPASCAHTLPVVKVGRRPDPDKHFVAMAGHFADVAQVKQVVGIDWMTGKELAQAIPPVYCEFIGRHLMEAMQV